MRRYEFTERGKIFLAVLLVLIILVIPAVLIALKNAAGATPDPEGESPSAGAPSRPPAVEITSTPNPAGPDVKPSGSGPENTGSPDPAQPSGQADSTPSGQEADRSEQDKDPPAANNTQPPPGTSPVNAPKDGEKLSFVFSPRSQTTLDDATEQKLDSFLKIPDYLPNYKIAAETPQISAEDARTLMRAVIDALSRRGVKSGQVEHISFPPAASGDSFEVNMYFVSAKEK